MRFSVSNATVNLSKPREIASYIEGEPYIGAVCTEPGMTNTYAASAEQGKRRAEPVREDFAGRDSDFRKPGERIVGFNTEHPELYEGTVRFDIVFYVRTKDGLSQIIINVEAQKERDFTGSDYDGIKSVYSIWVCMNMKENSMTHIHLTSENIVGDYEWKGNLKLLNIVMIGLAEELAGNEEEYALHRLLGALLSKELTAEERLEIIGTEYEIPIEKDFREDVNVMCNLSQGVKETGIAMGKLQMILNMRRHGFTEEQIALAAEKDVEEVRAIIAGEEAEQGLISTGIIEK